MAEPTRKDIQAYVDSIREKVPDLKGQSYGVTAKYAAKLYSPELDAKLPTASATDRAAIEGMRKLIPKPNYTMADFDRAADKGSTAWTIVKGALEGIDPIGKYTPLYDPEDEDSWTRSGAQLGGAVATGFIPVAGWGAKALQLTRAAKLIKTAKAAKITENVLGGLHHGANALQAQSGLRGANNQLGMDTSVVDATGLALLGAGASKVGTHFSGKAGAKAFAGRTAPVLAQTDMQMGTHPLIAQSEELKDTWGPMRYPTLIAKGVAAAKTPEEKLKVLATTLGLPLAMGGAAGLMKGKPWKVDVPDGRGGVWDTSPTAELPNVARPAPVATPTAATGAPEVDLSTPGPTASSREFFYPRDQVKDVVAADARYSLGRGLDKLREETYSDMPMEVNVIQPDGSRGAWVGNFGRERVSMLFPGQDAQSVSKRSVVGLPKEVNFSLGGDRRIRIAMDPDFEPGFQPGRMQVRTFKGDDGDIRVVVGHNATSKEFLVVNPRTGETRVGPRDAWPNMPKPFERTVTMTDDQKIAKGMALDQRTRDQQTAAPYPRPMTSGEDVLGKFNAIRTKFGF